MAVARYAGLTLLAVFFLLSHFAQSDSLVSLPALTRPGETITGLVDLTKADIDAAATELRRGSGSGRRLQVMCNHQMLSYFRPPRWSEYLTCVDEKFRTINSSIVASEVKATADCWCKHNVRQTISEWGCCDHSSFRAWCEIDCAADCASQKATQCYSTCPAICLEADYAPESCECQESGCYSYTRCIADKAAKDTDAGILSPVCDDQNFRKSKELNDYGTCLDKHPSRTNWHRHNSRAHCSCESGLQKQLQKHKCCGASWAKKTCNYDCKDKTACSTAEAKECTEGCKTTCHQLHPNMVTKECVDSCFTESKCGKYETCAPLDLPEYEYQCSDGSKPADNGCCPDDSLLKMGCPLLCGIRRNYIINGKLQCQCFQCPETQQQQDATFKAKVAGNIQQSGELIIKDICDQVTLDKCPTQAMKDMLQERDKALMDHVSNHQGSITSELENSMQITSSKWSARILLEAHREQDCASGALKASECEGGDVKSEQSSSLVIIIICVACALGACCIFAVIFILWRRTKKPAQGTGNNSNPIAPRDGDDQVVVGRPVETPEGAEATAGAPVQADEKAKGDPKEMDNAV